MICSIRKTKTLGQKCPLSYLVIFVYLFSISLPTISNAKELIFIAPIIPPHFDEKGKGRIGDVIQKILSCGGHTAKYVLVPFGRHWHDYKELSVYDALATAEANQTFPGYSTKAFIHLQDGAIVTESSGLEQIKKAEDLQGRNIVAFPNADKILPIQNAIKSFASFKMRSNREDQVRPLLANRADAIFADGLITAHYLTVLRERGKRGLEPDINTEINTKFRRIFKQGPQRLYFKDKDIQQSFDSCFDQLSGTDELENIARPTSTDINIY